MRDKPGIHAMYGVETVGVRPVFVSPTHFLEDLMTTKVKKKVSVEDVIHPVELNYQRSIPQMVLDWTEELVTRLQADYDRQYKSNSNPCKFSITTGRKYHKIVNRNAEVHAFVDKQTGEVFKPASYKAPAKHVRYDLRRIKQRHECFNNADWAGSYLYIRG